MEEALEQIAALEEVCNRGQMSYVEFCRAREAILAQAQGR